MVGEEQIFVERIIFLRNGGVLGEMEELFPRDDELLKKQIRFCRNG